MRQEILLYFDTENKSSNPIT